MLRKLKEQEITIIVSTPYMDEADLCDRIALIQDGKILSIDTPKAVVAAFPDQLYAVKADQMHQLLNALQASPLVKDSYAFGEYAHVTFEGDLEQELAAQGLTGIEVQTTPVTIEDCFIKLLKEKQ